MTILQKVIQWNNKYPYDYLWRKKYNIPFGSEQHLKTSHVDMCFDMIEEDYIRNKIKEKRDEDDFMLDSITIGDKSKDKVIKMAKKEVDEEFDNIDLTKY